jgi:3-oxoacyl-[acyl-carrier protein] reductase
MAVIITGGSRGLGLTLVRHYLSLGHNVASFSRNRSDAVSELLQDHPNSFQFAEVDASRAESLRLFVADVKTRFEKIDSLINNAGLAHDRVLPLMTDDQIEQMLDVNLKASLILARECARIMLTQSAGTIVNISSIIAQRGFSGLAAYAATKAGMIGMTKSLARELGPRGIRVNAVAPGFLDTEMSGSLEDRQRDQIIRRTPLGRLGTTEDVVSTVQFLTSEASQFITGQVITVDGGASI